MDIKNLKEIIAKLPDDAQFVVAYDEELNVTFSKWEICKLAGEKNEKYCIFGLSGSEETDDF